MDIELQKVSYSYGVGTPFEKRALFDVDLLIPSGSYQAIIGHTGSGKSTILQHLNALLKPTEGTVRIGSAIIESKKKCILVINKVDLVDKAHIAEIISLYSSKYEFVSVVPVSVVKNKNLDVLLQEIENHLKPGPAYYDTEEYTDQTLRQLAEETIREKALKLLNDEVPHGIYVEVDKMKSRKTKDKENIYDISATIYCLRNSHKGIIIGKNGQMLKRIGTYAREDLEKMLDIKVNLQLWVKVKEDWQDDAALLKKFKLQ